MPSFVNSFLSTDILSDSFILRFAMFVILVIPFAKADKTANVMTRSGVLFMSISPSGLSVFGPWIVISVFVCVTLHPIFLRYDVNAMSPWIDFWGMPAIVTRVSGFRAAYAPRYDADDASPSMKSLLSTGFLNFWFGATLRVLNDEVFSTLMPNFFINFIVISM